MAESQVTRFFRMTIGDYEVTVLSDGQSPLAAMKLLQAIRHVIRPAEALKRNFLGRAGGYLP